MKKVGSCNLELTAHFSDVFSRLESLRSCWESELNSSLSNCASAAIRYARMSHCCLIAMQSTPNRRGQLSRVSTRHFARAPRYIARARRYFARETQCSCSCGTALGVQSTIKKRVCIQWKKSFHEVFCSCWEFGGYVSVAAASSVREVTLS